MTIGTAVALTCGLVSVVTSSAALCMATAYTWQFFANTGFSCAAKRPNCDTAISEN
ncbi:hypothetical protein ABTY96_13460 [Streptomyces sp. NPDC096057]|uniref:hypothetical protein n=1 Tax=Streptomyces sp. NPDC096057 TaxID=3155543 RepID=UPI00332C7F09